MKSNLKKYSVEELRRLRKEVTAVYADRIAASRVKFRMTEESFALASEMSAINKMIDDELWERRERP